MQPIFYKPSTVKIKHIGKIYRLTAVDFNNRQTIQIDLTNKEAALHLSLALMDVTDFQVDSIPHIKKFVKESVKTSRIVYKQEVR